MPFVRPSQTIKSVSFRLTAAYAGLFALSVGILALVTYLSVTAELSREFHGRIQAESGALESDYKAGGVKQVLRAISDRQRGRLTDGLDFTLYDSAGRHLFGSLPVIACQRGWTTLSGPPDGDEAPGQLEQLGVYVTPLPNGLCLLVGDDWGEVNNFGVLILKTFGWVLALSLTMAVAGGLFLSSEFLKRIEAITKTAEAIIEGDINRRIPRRSAPDDLDRLAATLNRMLDRTSSLTERLKHLSNDIAHDLRTPLGRLRRQLEEGRSQTLTPDEYRDILEHSVEEVDGILNMFSAILRIAQIESGNRRSGFKRFCLSDLVADICETFEPALEEDGRILRQNIEPDLWIHGDQELLTLSLANLLENAATHTPVDSRITVSLKSAGGHVELGVADDGAGVPEADRNQIFRRFYRLESSRTTAGNGLGLSIVAAVAELHAAEVSAADNAPGLKVAIVFPAAA
jgi:signal transduction histidine kinase